MFNAFSKVTTKIDKTKDIKQLLDELAKKQVYVGIPEGDTGAHLDITNAELMYILTHGVREKSMRDEMDDMMQIGSNGVPYSTGYNKFLNNMGGGMPYSEAYDLYIHEHGSPLWHIPPRPVLEPSIEHNKEIIANQLKKALQTALGGSDPTMELNKAGQLGANAAKDWFYNPENRWPANSPTTVKLKGSERPNIDTGNLRNSITYVVAKKS